MLFRSLVVAGAPNPAVIISTCVLNICSELMFYSGVWFAWLDIVNPVTLWTRSQPGHCEKIHNNYSLLPLLAADNQYNLIMVIS